MRRIAGQPAGLVDVDPLRAMVAELDLTGGGLRIVSGGPGDPRALVLVRRGRRVVDLVEVLGAHDLSARLSARLSGRLADTSGAETSVRGWRPGSGAALSASIVICTVGTNPLLTAAVRAALAQEHEDFEVLVVDNAPARGGTRRLLEGVEDPRVRIVEEPLPGLSRARNRGVLHARGEVIAFTDDDAVTDVGWLPELLDVLASDPGGEVGGVTGIALPAELRHRSQRFFESRGGFPKDLRPLVWSLGHVSPRITAFGEQGEGGPLHPLTTARVGAGVSMAFRREVLEVVGPFDPALGAGTPTLGGEDMDIFARVLRGGWAIVHTPDAVLFHSHRPTLGELHRQIHGNGTGSAALLVKAVLEDPRRGVHLISRVPRALRRVAPGSERIRGRDADVPTSLSVAEMTGFLVGPLLYLRSRLAARGAGEGS